MAIQLHTFAKLSGKTGDAAYRLIKEWSQIEEKADQEDRYFPRRTLPEVTRFVKGLRQNLTDPATLHFVQFLDTWSVAFGRLMLLCDLPSFILIKNAGPYTLGAYRLPDEGLLRNLLKRQLRRRHVREVDQEARFFAVYLLETLSIYENICPAATIIMVRQSLAASFDDNDLVRASESPARWIMQ